MLARIAALLRQAEGTDNAHEADAFMAAAQRLATATSIDLAVARAHSATRTAATAPVQRTITIGAPGARAAYLCAAVRRDRHGQRRALRRGDQFDLCVRLRLRRGHRRHPRPLCQPGRSDGPGLDTYIATGEHRPTPTITARLNFHLAFGARVGQRLAEARDETRRDAEKDRNRAPGTAIALRNKELELRDFYRGTSKARGTWRATRASAGYSSAARRAGDRAGRRARLGDSAELSVARSALER